MTDKSDKVEDVPAGPVTEFIPADEYVEDDQVVAREYPLPEGMDSLSEEARWCRRLAAVAEVEPNVARVRKPKGLDGRQNALAVDDAFELIGGVPRLAKWADENPTQFYRSVWSKRLPSTAHASVDLDGEVVIKHVLPRSPLDG